MINYKLIDDSINYYSKRKFTRIESPWIVSDFIDQTTKPKGIQSFVIQHLNQNLVASGEQSFLSLYLNESLPKGKFQTVTPCFRDDPVDYLHKQHFIKNELIQTENVNVDSLIEMINVAFDFYLCYFKQVRVVEVEKNIQYDIFVDEHELGSYGIRKCEFLEWIYGTGCAEPRTSSLLKKYGNKWHII